MFFVELPIKTHPILRIFRAKFSGAVHVPGMSVKDLSGAVLLQRHPHDIKPKPAPAHLPAARLLDAIECFKDVRQRIFRDMCSGIFDIKENTFLLLPQLQTDLILSLIHI